MENVAAERLRLQGEITRIDPVTTKGRTVALLAGSEVVWQGEVEDAKRTNLLPKFAELLVLDVQLPDGSEVQQLLTVVADVGERMNGTRSSPTFTSSSQTSTAPRRGGRNDTCASMTSTRSRGT